VIASSRGRRLFGISAERVAARIGRGLTIILPVAGGIFAFYLFQSDYRRWKQELQDSAIAHESPVSSATRFRLRRPSLALVLFSSAGMADFMDAALHFFIAFLFVSSHGSHHHPYAMVVAEEWSMGCAVVSTVAAVLGEIASHRNQQKRHRRAEV